MDGSEWRGITDMAQVDRLPDEIEDPEFYDSLIDATEELPVTEHPEHDKLIAARDKLKLLNEFTTWLSEHYVLCDMPEEPQDYMPTQLTEQQIVAKFLDIDATELANEKDAMCQAVCDREAQQQQPAPTEALVGRCVGGLQATEWALAAGNVLAIDPESDTILAVAATEEPLEKQFVMRVSPVEYFHVPAAGSFTARQGQLTPYRQLAKAVRPLREGCKGGRCRSLRTMAEEKVAVIVDNYADAPLAMGYYFAVIDQTTHYTHVVRSDVFGQLRPGDLLLRLSPAEPYINLLERYGLRDVCRETYIRTGMEKPDAEGSDEVSGLPGC